MHHQIYKKLPYNVGGAINEKPHECGALFSLIKKT